MLGSRDIAIPFYNVFTRTGLSIQSQQKQRTKEDVARELQCARLGGAVEQSAYYIISNDASEEECLISNE